MSGNKLSGKAGLALFVVALLIIAVMPAPAQKTRLNETAPARETPEQFARRTKWWREAKFGMFIHWGIYAVPADATFQDGKTKGIAEWYFSNKQMQVKDYEKFAPQFNPRYFDAKQWVGMAKNAGMKYLVITSKHHDGFAIFDSKVSKYDVIDASPFKRDILKELSVECKKQGVKLCFYHSIMDWHHPDYLPRRPWEKDVRPAEGADFDRYVAYMKAQLKELVTQYDPAVLWFDGEWEPTWTHAHAIDLYNYLKSLKPSLLINNRIDKGRQGMAGMNASDEFLGDFGTPEQEIPAAGFADDRLWETCMTMNDTWGYARNDHNWKTPEALIRNLCDIAHKGGNFLLNVGPTDLGEFTPETQNILASMGRWMKTNSAAIHGTTKSPFKRLSFDGRCTRKGNTLYLHVFNWPASELTLLGLRTKVNSARKLGGEQLSFQQVGAPGQPSACRIARPAMLDPVATVIELRLAGAPDVEQGIARVRSQSDGSYVLNAADATIEGHTAKVEIKDGKENIGYWTDAKDVVTWLINPSQDETYHVEIEYACEPSSAGSVVRILVEGGERAVRTTVANTGGWSNFRTETLEGTLRLPAGKRTVRVIPETMPKGAVMNLRRIVLKPTP